jgi:signal transduction histidine kinase/Tfp pilus assembly protein PilF
MPLKRIISIIITGLLLLPSSYCFAQQFLLDSLVKRLKATTINDTNYVNTLSALGVLYQHRDKDSMLLIADRIIDLSKKINYTRGYANGHKIKGIAYIYLLKKERALFHDSIAIAEYTKINDIKGIGAVYNNMAVLLNSYGEYNSANMFYQKSITYRKQVNDLKGVGDCETNMGNNKMAVGDYNGALVHMLNGLSIRKEIHDMEGLTNSYTNLGNLYFYMRNYKKSEESYRESFRIKQKIGSFAELANLYINLGGLYYQKGNFDTASLYFNKALKISKEKNDVESIVIALNNISELASTRNNYQGAFAAVEEAEKYVNLNIDNESKIVLYSRKAICYSNVKQYQSAIKYATIALETAKKINARRSLPETTELLSELYEKNGDDHKALFYYKLAKQYSDSVFNEESMTKFNDYEYKYKIQDKEQEILRLETSKKIEQEKNNLLKIGFILLLVVIVGISLLAYSINGNRKKEKYINELNNKQNETLAQLNSFKDKVFSIIAHDLRSPIASIQSMFSLLDQGLISQEDFMTFRKDMTNQVTTLSQLLENLLSWSKKQMQGGLQTIKSEVVIKDAINQNIALFNEISISKQIDVKSTAFENLKIMADVDQFDLIIRNLLSNAIKFTPKGGSIFLDAKEENGQIKISIKDSGVGMNQNTVDKIFANEIISLKGTNGEKGSGLGLSLTKEFIENNNGTFNICSKPDKGTEITITFNKA